MFLLVLYGKILYDIRTIKRNGMMNEVGVGSMAEFKIVDVIIPVCMPDERTVQSVKRLLKQTYPLNRIYLIHTEKGMFQKNWRHYQRRSTSRISGRSSSIMEAPGIRAP